MTTHHRYTNLSRLAIASAFLLTGLAGGAQAALAGSPLDDAGGPSGGSDAVAEGPIFLEELGLVSTNDPAEPITGHTRLDGPSLVGSGPEREFVESTNEVPILVGSGADRELVTGSGATTNIAVDTSAALHGLPY